MASQIWVSGHVLTFFSSEPALCFFVIYTDDVEDGGIIVDIKEVSSLNWFYTQNNISRSECRRSDGGVPIPGPTTRWASRSHIKSFN